MATAARFLGSLSMSLAAFVLAVPLLACSQGAGTTGDSPPPASAAAPPVDPAAGAPSQARGLIIAKVVTHDATVAILSGGQDLRVVVRKLDGTLVADGLTLAELRVQQPEIYVVVTSAFASNSEGTFVDATLGPMN
jgi:hypothetical protein